MEYTLISENSILTATKSKVKYFSPQTTKNHLPTEMSNSSMTITCHHQNSRSKYMVLNGILIGGKCYSNPPIIPDLHYSIPHANIKESMQYSLLPYSGFAHLCDKYFGKVEITYIQEVYGPPSCTPKITYNLSQDYNI